MRPILLCILFIFGLSTAANAQQLKEITNSIGMKLVLIHAGSFTMGSPIEEVGRNEIEKQHEVTISKSFYLCAFEVTQEQYEKVMGNNPSHFKGHQLPVEMVTFDNAVSFCEKLSELQEEKAAGRVYRLPTEAEWEYACRATSTTMYFFGDTADELGDYAWFGKFPGETHPVGEKKSNRWGLYDIYGNVFEWCQDRDSASSSGLVTDPFGPSKNQRIARGGEWSSQECRSATRVFPPKNTESAGIGFRVVLNRLVKLQELTPTK